MHKHFVTFYSPGTFMAETSDRLIASWDIAEAVRMSQDIKERYGATPYAFRFTTWGRKDDELDSREIERSPTYFLGGKIKTLEDVEATQPGTILARNMRTNGYARVITTTEGWRWTQPLNDRDVVLDMSQYPVSGVPSS